MPHSAGDGLRCLSCTGLALVGVGRQHHHSQAAAWGLLGAGCWIPGTRRARSSHLTLALALSTIQAAKNCTQNPRGGPANVNCDAPELARTLLVALFQTGSPWPSVALGGFDWPTPPR